MKLDLMSEIQTGVAATNATKPAERSTTSSTSGARSSGAAKSSGSNGASGVTVTLSSAAESSSTQEVVDQSKVDSIKDAIAKGSFTINAEAIADKLLSNAQEMLAAAKQNR